MPATAPPILSSLPSKPPSAQLQIELNDHFAKEESVLFPYIVGLERSLTDPDEEPISCFGFLPEPVAVLSHDHEQAVHPARAAPPAQPSLHAARWASASPTASSIPGCRSWSSDLRQHMHLENNILFPRAVQLEDATAFATP